MQIFKKIILSIISIVISLASLPTMAEATKVDQVKDVAPVQQCQKLFKETENLIAEAEKQPGTHLQLQNIKSKLKQSKQQILEMEIATQSSLCDKGLAKLSNIAQE